MTLHNDPVEPHDFATFVRAIGTVHGGRVALVKGTAELSYEALEQQSAELARVLVGWGAGKGTHVGYVLANGPSAAIALFAITRIGAVAVPLSTFFRGTELAEAIRRADVHGLLIDELYADHDYVGSVTGALPELADSSSTLILRSAPNLRWIASQSQPDSPPAWLRSTTPAAPTAAFDEPLLHELEADVHPSDPALMILTSGSSSTPKGVLHTHEAVLSKTRYMREMLAIGPDLRYYTNMPWFWVGGLMVGLLPTLMSGATLHSTDRFEPGTFLALAATQRFTRVMLNPPNLVRTVQQHPNFATTDLSSLGPGTTPGLSPTPLENANPYGLFASLGMTETLGMYSWGTPVVGPDGVISVPLEHFEPGYVVKVVDGQGAAVADGEQGEICIKGPTLSPRLYKESRSERFDSDGFYRTGDMGEVDGSRIHFRGRRDNMIKAKGANVSAAEVERALSLLPGVSEAFVVGVDDGHGGQVVGAAVVPVLGTSLDPDHLRAQLREQLSSFKVPSVLVVRDRESIAFTGSGKVRQGVLREALAHLVATSASESSRNDMRPDSRQVESAPSSESALLA